MVERNLLLYLMVGTWSAMVVAVTVLLWRFHRLDRKADAIWDFLMGRAEAVAIEDGWVHYVAPPPKPVGELPIGFVPAASASAEKQTG